MDIFKQFVSGTALVLLLCCAALVLLLYCSCSARVLLVNCSFAAPELPTAPAPPPGGVLLLPPPPPAGLPAAARWEVHCRPRFACSPTCALLACLPAHKTPLKACQPDPNLPPASCLLTCLPACLPARPPALCRAEPSALRCTTSPRMHRLCLPPPQTRPPASGRRQRRSWSPRGRSTTSCSSCGTHTRRAWGSYGELPHSRLLAGCTLRT